MEEEVELAAPSKEFCEGVRAYYQNKKVTDNPYGTDFEFLGPLKKNQWTTGYHMAMYIKFIMEFEH